METTFNDIQDIAIAAIRQVAYCFLLLACSNNIAILHRFRDITISGCSYVTVNKTSHSAESDGHK